MKGAKKANKNPLDKFIIKGAFISKYDEFSETFTGTIGPYSVTLTGYAGTSRYTNLTKVK
jgi:hypothetical protein